MQTLASEYGREPLTVASEIPTHALRDLLGWKHISTPAAEIAEWARERAVKSGFTHAQVRETVEAALWLHEENRALYRWVMGGMP